MPTTHLLYLHGFRSSPQSAKARQTAARVARDHPEVTWWCPQLPPSPREAMALVMQGIAGWPRDAMGVIGSSLGGYYATWVAQRTGGRAVLLNPAVHAARDIGRHLGEQVAWHDPGQRFVVEPHHVDELQALEAGPLAHPGRVLAIVAKGDEVLDWREMVARYPGSAVELLEGGDHALSDYEAAHLDRALAFLDLAR